MINRPEKVATPRVDQPKAPERVFDALLDKAKTLATSGTGDKTFKPRVLAAEGVNKPDDYKEVTALPAKLDIDTLKVVSEDKDAGVIYFEQDGNKFKITREGAEKAQEGFDTLKNLHFGHAVAPVNQGGPDEGTPLFDFLHTLAETQGTPAGQAILESLRNPDQQLLREDSDTVRLANIKSVGKAEDGVVKVEMASGKTLVVSELLTPQAFASFNQAGVTKEALADGKAKGFEEVTSLPGDLDFSQLKVVSEDASAGVIQFEHQGHKYMIAQSEANLPQPGADLANPNPNAGGTFYNFLHAVHASEGTQAFDYIKNAQSLPGQELLRKDEASLKLGDISKVDTPMDGILVVNQADGKLLVVAKDITPEAFAAYSTKGQTLTGIEKAKGDGYTLASPDAYLASTEDIMSVGGAGDYGPGLIAFTQHKPGGSEEKIVVSEDSNPQMFKQISDYRSDIAAQTTDVDKLRTDNGLPPLKDVSVDNLATTEKDENGAPLSVQDLSMKTLVDGYRAGVKDGSIGKDDPRAKFLRAVEARSMADNGMSIIPEHGFGNLGIATTPIDVTSRDVRDNIFDTKAIDQTINDLLGDSTIQHDIKASHDAALGKVDGGQAKVDETRQKLLDSTSSENFTKYIKALQDDGKTELATQEIQTAYSALADIDPAKADNFLQNLQIDGYTDSVEKLMDDPTKISDANTALATTDNTVAILSMLKGGADGLPRQALGVYSKFVDQLLKDKNAAADFGKAMISLGDTWQKNGVISFSDIDKAVSKEIMPNLSEENRSAFVKNLNFLKDNGVLGSVGGAIGMGRIVYQLAGQGGKLADTPMKRLGIANDFLGFLGTGSHFATLGLKVYDKLRGTNAYKLMGFDRSLPDLWAKPAEGYHALPKDAEAIQKKYFEIVDQAMDDGKDVGKALNSGGWSDDAALKVQEGIEKGIASRGGVAGAGFGSKFASSALKVIGMATDVAGGVISVVQAAFTLRDGVRDKDPVKIASGSLSMAGGVSSLVGAAGGVLGTLGVTGRIIPFLGPVGFLVSGALSFVGAILSTVQSHKLHKISMQNWNQVQDFKQDGLLKPNGDEAYVWLQTYLSDWGQRDAPQNQSIFDFRKEEWDARSSIRGGDHRRDHPDYIGDGNNRNSEDYKYSLKPSKWEDDNHTITWRVGDGYGGPYHDVDNP
ncbi:MAG: hypothetical protein GAK37_03527 [Pseudomonas sp.]|nr:MAG: hypothetical protein GAK37_03527 [Pseudomonas sp.]